MQHAPFASPSSLKNSLKIEKEEEDLFDAIFESELQNALDFVSNDMNENNEDSIDAKSREFIAKKRKLCENNHINDNVRTNRKRGLYSKTEKRYK